MEKVKFQIEYVFEKVSRHTLWLQLSTPLGLSKWFCDAVKIDEDKYTFVWNNTSETAFLVDSLKDKHIKFRWSEEADEDYYFEFWVHEVELTGDVVLEITDFTEPEEKGESIDLWDSQVESLKRSLGI